MACLHQAVSEAPRDATQICRRQGGQGLCDGAMLNDAGRKVDSLPDPYIALNTHKKRVEGLSLKKEGTEAMGARQPAWADCDG